MLFLFKPFHFPLINILPILLFLSFFLSFFFPFPISSLSSSPLSGLLLDFPFLLPLSSSGLCYVHFIYTTITSEIAIAMSGKDSNRDPSKDCYCDPSKDCYCDAIEMRIDEIGMIEMSMAAHHKIIIPFALFYPNLIIYLPHSL